MTTVVASGAVTDLIAGDVVAVVGLLVRAVEDPVERVGDVSGGQRLAVRPLHAGADRVGPRAVVGGLLPLGGEPRHRREVLLAVADQGVVHHSPGLVRLRVDAGERVERVDVLDDADGAFASNTSTKYINSLY